MIKSKHIKMKNLLVLFALVIGLTFTSCQKQEPLVVETTDSGIDETISIFGEWVLVDGKMYMENLETGAKTVYNHFDATKTVSSLRYSGYMFNFERIVVDSTTWTFTAPPSVPGTGEFWLDNDSLQPYGFHITSSNMTIVESSTGPTQLGGSSRPLTTYVYDYDANQVNFYVQEAYESIAGENYKYFSELTFEKQK